VTSSGRICRSCGAHLASDNPDDRCGPCQRREPALQLEPPKLDDACWDAPAIQQAVAERHFGHLLLAYRKAVEPELRQAEVGRWLGLTQGQVSRIERTPSPVHDLAKLERWAAVLHIPQRCLWFSLPQSPDTSGDAEAVSSLETQEPDDEEADVHRRDLLRSATAVVGSGLLADTPWQRLSDSISRGRAVDQTTVRVVEDRTARFFDDEETRPARVILATIQDHRCILEALVANARREDLRTRLLISMAESDALLGWMLFDLRKPHAAVEAWRRALRVAKHTGDGALAACALGYWSYLAAANGDAAGAMRLLHRAESHVAGPTAPATRSWIAVRQAEEAARLGDTTEALRALDRSLTAFDFASPRTERPWTGFFTASRLGSSTVTTYTTLNHREADTAANSLLGTLTPADNKVRGLVLADLATAAAHGRNYERADDLAVDALQVATRTEASLAKARLHNLAMTLPANAGPAERLRQRITTGLAGSRP